MPKDLSPASAAEKRRERKAKYIVRLNNALENYVNVLVVQADNVGSNQMQQVRLALRKTAVVIMGKNTLMRRIIRDKIATGKYPQLENLLPLVVGNMGFVFTEAPLNDIRKVITNFKVPAAARLGTNAPNAVIIPAMNTGLDPGQTAFFQTLNISTKIVKGAIEIQNDVTLLRPGDKVSASHVALLDKLNIRPFQYGLLVSTVYENGTVYDAAVLDMSQDDLMAKFAAGISKVAALSLGAGIPTAASLPHNIANAFKKLLFVSLATEYTFPAAQKVKDILANPGAFASAAPVAAASSAAAAAAPEPEKSESEADMGFSLFD